MDNFSHLLAAHPLFEGVPEDHIPSVLECLHGTRKTFAHRTLLFHSGGPVPNFGIVLKGSAEIFLACQKGNGALIAQFHPGDLFAEALCIAKAPDSLYELYTSDDSEILFMTVPEFTSLKNCGCTYRFLVMEHLMKMVAEGNVRLLMKIQILTQNTLREKLMLYFSVLSRQQGTATVTLPFGRDKLAFYLASDRSAVSREMSRMQKDGLITCGKGTVTLL